MAKNIKLSISNKKCKMTFSKKAVTAILVVALIDLQFTYVLAYLDKVEVAQSLSITICTEIIGVMLGYFLKSFFETREEKRTELEEKKLVDTEDDIIDN